MENSQRPFDLAKTVFELLILSLLIVTCFWVLQPFILGYVWASMVVTATWPLMLKVEKRLWNKRLLATLFMTFLTILLFVIPIALLVGSFLQSSGAFINLIKSPANIELPEMLWLKDLPFVGHRVYNGWHSAVTSGGNALLAKIQPYFGQTANWFLAQALNISRFMFHLFMMLLFSALLFWKGDQVMLAIRHFAIRLAGQRGDAAVILAALSVRAVALGIVVTALVQTIIAGTGLALSGIPYTALLTIALFICCVAQLGPLLVMVPATLWLFWMGDTTWGIIMIFWSGFVATLDAFLRPWLIKMSADLPIALIILGVIGGILSFGMIGLFIGPVVLAVSYSLLTTWMSDIPTPTSDLTNARNYITNEFKKRH